MIGRIEQSWSTRIFLVNEGTKSQTETHSHGTPIHGGYVYRPTTTQKALQIYVFMRIYKYIQYTYIYIHNIYVLHVYRPIYMKYIYIHIYYVYIQLYI